MFCLSIYIYLKSHVANSFSSTLSPTCPSTYLSLAPLLFTSTSSPNVLFSGLPHLLQPLHYTILLYCPLPFETSHLSLYLSMFFFHILYSLRLLDALPRAPLLSPPFLSLSSHFPTLRFTSLHSPNHFITTNKYSSPSQERATTSQKSSAATSTKTTKMPPWNHPQRKRRRKTNRDVLRRNDVFANFEAKSGMDGILQAWFDGI